VYSCVALSKLRYLYLQEYRIMYAAIHDKTMFVNNLFMHSIRLFFYLKVDTK